MQPKAVSGVKLQMSAKNEVSLPKLFGAAILAASMIAGPAFAKVGKYIQKIICIVQAFVFRA